MRLLIEIVAALTIGAAVLAVIGLSVSPPNPVSPNLVLGANAPDRALGELRCEGRGAVIINVDGRDYAVNGMAGPRYPPIQTLWNKEFSAPGRYRSPDRPGLDVMCVVSLPDGA